MSNPNSYGFIVSENQFGRSVLSDYVDGSELPMIGLFETELKKLAALGKPMYSMIELGSNQAFYSLMFKHIIGVDKTLSIMIEPTPANFERSKQQFAINNCTGVFYNRRIGNEWICSPRGMKSWRCFPITLREALQENSLKELDVLHCDIDGSELKMLEGDSALFDTQSVNCIVIAVHSGALHGGCKTFLESRGYQLVGEKPLERGNDGFVVYHRKNLFAD